MPLRTVFGWQKPCYLLGEGYVDSYAELMEGTEWQNYGVGNYEKCADCMVHCGFEGSAVKETLSNPLKMMKVAFGGIKTDGAFAPEIDLSRQRPAQNVFSMHVEEKLEEIRSGKLQTIDITKKKRDRAAAAVAAE